MLLCALYMRLVLVDDWAILRELWRAYCETSLGDVCEIVGEAGDGAEAVACILKTNPDCVVLDLELPLKNGFEVIATVRCTHPRVQFIVVSAHCTPWAVSIIRQLGIVGFVYKQCERLHTIGEAVRAVALGKTYFSPQYEAMVVHLQKGEFLVQQRLSRREIQLLTYFSQARSDEEIAKRMNVSAMTIKTHRGRILRKLDLPNSASLVNYLHTSGFATFAISGEIVRTMKRK